MQDSIETRVKEVIADVMGIVDENSLTRSSNVITDLGADEIDAQEIVMGLEDEFDTSIELSAKLQTVGGCIDYITAAVQQQ